MCGSAWRSRSRMIAGIGTRVWSEIVCKELFLSVAQCVFIGCSVYSFDLCVWDDLEAANQLVDFVCSLIEGMSRAPSKTWLVLENPQSSLLWSYPSVHKLMPPDWVLSRMAVERFWHACWCHGRCCNQMNKDWGWACEIWFPIISIHFIYFIAFPHFIPITGELCGPTQWTKENCHSNVLRLSWGHVSPFPRSHPSLVMNESFDHCAFGEVYKKRTRLLMWRSGSCKSGVADLTRTLRKCSCGKKHEQLSGLEAKEKSGFKTSQGSAYQKKKLWASGTRAAQFVLIADDGWVAGVHRWNRLQSNLLWDFCVGISANKGDGSVHWVGMRLLKYCSFSI